MRLPNLPNVHSLQLYQQHILRQRKSLRKSYSLRLRLPKMSSRKKIWTKTNLLLHKRKSMSKHY